ncbi:MAG: hypothetical protein R3C03_05275 [Pirellulaceae bacterium]
MAVILVLSLNLRSLIAQDFQWRLDEGDELEVLLEQSSTAITECDSQSSTTQMSIALNLDWQVMATTAESSQVRQVIQSIKMTVTTPTADSPERIDLDTENELPPRSRALEYALAKELKALVGQGALLTISKKGKVVDVELDDALFEAIKNADSSMPLRSFMTADGLQDAFRTTMFELPDGEIESGHTWESRTEDFGAFGKQIYVNGYEFVGAENYQGRELAKFGLVTSRDDSLPRSLPMNGDFDETNTPPELLTVHGDGEFWFDDANGFFVEGNSRTKVTTQQKYRDLIFNTEVNSESKLSVKKK